jgi:hypothetical protein
VEDGDNLPQFARASQNIAAAAALLQRLPELATPEERKTQWEIRDLLECAAEQQADGLLSQWHRLDTSQWASTEHDDRDASVHQAPHGMGAANLPLIQECVGPIRDARVVLDARRS